MSRNHLLASIAAIALITQGAYAAAVGVDFAPTSAGNVRSQGDIYTVGYEFQALTSAYVVGLAAWNSGVTGTVEVGLWNSSGGLIGELSVTASSPTVGDANWLYANFATPVVLTTGGDYYVGAWATSGSTMNFVTNVTSLTVDPQIKYLNEAWAGPVGGVFGLYFPSSTASYEYPAYFGGNILLSAPEPATWALMGIGFAGLAAVAVRRRHAAPAA